MRVTFLILVVKGVNLNENTHNTVDWIMLSLNFALDFLRNYDLPLPYSLPIRMGRKQVRLRVNLFSLENRTRDLNWKVEVGTLAPWCIMGPDITWT